MAELELRLNPYGIETFNGFDVDEDGKVDISTKEQLLTILKEHANGIKIQWRSDPRIEGEKILAVQTPVSFRPEGDSIIAYTTDTKGKTSDIMTFTAQELWEIGYKADRYPLMANDDSFTIAMPFNLPTEAYTNHLAAPKELDRVRFRELEDQVHHLEHKQDHGHQQKKCSTDHDAMMQAAGRRSLGANFLVNTLESYKQQLKSTKE